MIDNLPLHPSIMSLQPTTLLAFDAKQDAWVSYHNATSAVSSSDSVSKYPLRVVSWNIWEDSRHHQLRHQYIISTLLSDFSGPSYDVVCLQEVTALFFEKLLVHTKARDDWLITDLKEQFDLCPNFYSSVIMVRRKHGGIFQLSSLYMEFPNTRMARGLVVVQFAVRDRVVLRIGTAHFESHPEDIRKRHEQFDTTAYILANSGNILDENRSLNSHDIDDGQTPFIPAIFTGDCNVRGYSELDPLIYRHHFHDAFLIAHPISDSESPFFAHPTYGLTLINQQNTFKFKAGPPKRLDYVFVRVWK